MFALDFVSVIAAFKVQEVLQESLTWIQSLGVVGPIVFIGLYILATVLFVPGTILTLGAGVVFGVVFGSIYVFIGATLGAAAAFLIGRYLARGWVSGKLADKPQFKTIDQSVAQSGFKIVLLTRLSPVFPFVLLNYAFGLTQVSFRDFVLGSIGMIPGTILYVYTGSLAADFATPGTPSPTAEWILRIVGFIATIAVTIYVTRIAQKALNDNISSGESDA